MNEAAPSGIQGVMRFHERAEHLAALRELDRRAMAAWSDADLAAWQQKWPPDSGPWRLGDVLEAVEKVHVVGSSVWWMRFCCAGLIVIMV